MRILFASFALIAGVIVGVTFSAATGGSAAPSGGTAPAVQHWSINSTEVIAPDDACTDNTGYPLDGVTGTASCTRYYAAVHLPDGSEVIEMTVEFEDSVDTNGVFALSRTALDASADAGTGFRHDSVGTPGRSSETLTGNHIIDNSAYHYRFGANVGVGVTFYSAVITYIPPATGGAFANGDVDCNGTVAARDQQAVLRFILGQSALSQTEPCADVGS